MSLKSKYSPPFTVRVLDDTEDAATLTFNRMLRVEWKVLAEQIKAGLIDAENAKINIEAKDLPAHERQVIRARVRDHFEQEVTLSRVVRDCSQTAGGIDQLLQFALVDKSQAEYLDMLAPAETQAIIDQIVCLPVVKPSDPPELPPQNEASSGGSEPSTENPNGTDSTPTSNPPSPSDSPTT